jgi:transcriptional regulator with XRE-family HTH domain
MPRYNSRLKQQEPLLTFVRDQQLGTTLRDMRKARHISRARLAHMAGVTAACLARFEAGEARMPAAILKSCAQHLGVPLSALFSVPACTPRAGHADRGLSVH